MNREQRQILTSRIVKMGPRPECYKHQTANEYQDGVEQMLCDLTDLAERDGCIAAAWSLKALEAIFMHGTGKVKLSK